MKGVSTSDSWVGLTILLSLALEISDHRRHRAVSTSVKHEMLVVTTCFYDPQ